MSMRFPYNQINVNNSQYCLRRPSCDAGGRLAVTYFVGRPHPSNPVYLCTLLSLPASNTRLFLNPGPGPVYGVCMTRRLLIHILTVRQRSLPFSLHVMSTHTPTGAPCSSVVAWLQ